MGTGDGGWNTKKTRVCKDRDLEASCKPCYASTYPTRRIDSVWAVWIPTKPIGHLYNITHGHCFLPKYQIMKIRLSRDGP